MLEWVKEANSSAVTTAFARRFRALAAEAAGPCAVALTGGESAGVFYDALAKAGVPDNVTFYWSDERVVPLDSADSNYRLARERLLRPAKVGPDRIFAVETKLDPAAAAAAYAGQIRQKLGGAGAGLPRFPLIILGLGTDGHTGSLFPGRDPYQDDALLVRAVEETPEHPHPRVTFTPQLINAAAEVWFVITGTQKDWAVEQLERRTAAVKDVPALAVDPAKTQVVIFHA